MNVAKSQVDLNLIRSKRLVGNEPNLLSYYTFDPGTISGSTVSNLVSGTPTLQRLATR